MRIKIASFIEKKWHFLFVIVSLTEIKTKVLRTNKMNRMGRLFQTLLASFYEILSLDSGYKYDGTPRSFTYAAGIVYILLHNRKTSLIHPKKEALLISSSDEKLNILANE